MLGMPDGRAPAPPLNLVPRLYAAILKDSRGRGAWAVGGCTFGQARAHPKRILNFLSFFCSFILSHSHYMVPNCARKRRSFRHGNLCDNLQISVTSNNNARSLCNLPIKMLSRICYHTRQSTEVPATPVPPRSSGLNYRPSPHDTSATASLAPPPA